MKTTPAREVRVGDVIIGQGQPLALISGPCVIESEEHCLFMAQKLKEISQELDFPFIFKSSFDKANRSSIGSYRGPGLEKGLEILARVRKEGEVPVLTDVHCVSQVEAAAEAVDVLQVPAFLCRQTDLLLACGQTGKPVNIKKGQFLSPTEIGLAVEKIISTGNNQILLTERGTSFGYNNLVVDMRSLPIMRDFGCPVVFDGTHSVQLPGAAGQTSGGERRFVEVLCRAAVAAGVDAVFLEVHDNPDTALCDGPNMLPLSELKPLLTTLQNLQAVVKEEKIWMDGTKY